MWGEVGYLFDLPDQIFLHYSHSSHTRVYNLFHDPMPPTQIKTARNNVALSGLLSTTLLHIYFASPICLIYVWLSQKRYSSTMTPFSQTPMVHIGSLNAFPVG